MEKPSRTIATVALCLGASLAQAAVCKTCDDAARGWRDVSVYRNAPRLPRRPAANDA